MTGTAVRSGRRVAMVTFLAAAALSLAGCGGSMPAPAASGASTAPSTAGAVVAVGGSAAGTPAALTCAGLDSARIHGSAAPYNLMGEAGIPLEHGQWTGADGRHVGLQPPCAVGDLDAHPGDELVASVMLDTPGTTGRYWSLVMCKRQGGGVLCGVVKNFDDREPVQSITIHDETAIVGYLTRTPDVPLAGINLQRTVVYQFAGNALHELSHSDMPYTP